LKLLPAGRSDLGTDPRRLDKLREFIRFVQMHFSSRGRPLPPAVEELVRVLTYEQDLGGVYEDGLSLYAYLHSSPISSVDPSGQAVATTLPYVPDTSPWDHWSAVHCWFGVLGGMMTPAGPDGCLGLVHGLAIVWEMWEPGHWPGWHESPENQENDILIATICCLLVSW